jgi:hypothetical protein
MDELAIITGPDGSQVKVEAESQSTQVTFVFTDGDTTATIVVNTYTLDRVLTALGLR